MHHGRMQLIPCPCPVPNVKLKLLQWAETGRKSAPNTCTKIKIITPSFLGSTHHFTAEGPWLVFVLSLIDGIQMHFAVALKPRFNPLIYLFFDQPGGSRGRRCARLLWWGEHPPPTLGQQMGARTQQNEQKILLRRYVPFSPLHTQDLATEEASSLRAPTDPNLLFLGLRGRGHPSDADRGEGGNVAGRCQHHPSAPSTITCCPRAASGMHLSTC